MNLADECDTSVNHACLNVSWLSLALQLTNLADECDTSVSHACLNVSWLSLAVQLSAHN